MNVTNFIIRFIVGLWLIPYLIIHIGKAAYGLVPLAMIFTEYINLITGSINASITRFLAIDIQKKDFDNANKTFNTAFFAILGLVLFKIPILSYIVIDLQSLINVPAELSEDAFYLFSLSFLGYLISLFSSIFSTSLYANNRLDLIRFIEITRLLVRASTIVGLFLTFSPSLKYVGIANLMSALVGILISFIYWKKFTAYFKLGLSYFDKYVFSQITKMGGWIIVNQVGFLLLLKVDLIVVNRFIGPDAGGEYAAVQQWTKLLRSIAGVLSAVIGPMVLISYANSKMKDLIKFAKLGVRYMSIGIGIITGVICGLASPLLGIWLGPSFTQFSSLLIIMLCTLVINLGILPLFKISTAVNKVKIPGLVTLFAGGFNLFLAIFFVTKTDLGLIGVALAGAIVLTLKNGIFIPIYTARILNISTLTFYKPLLGGVFLFLLSLLISSFWNHYAIINTWMELILYSILTLTFALLTALIFIISNEDKIMFVDMLPKQFRIFLSKFR